MDSRDEHGVVRRVVVDHLTLKVSDFDASRRFYLAALAPLGFGIVYETDYQASFGVEGADDFAISEGAVPSAISEGAVPSAISEGAVPSVGVHLAFASTDRESVANFHSAALEAGGTDNGPPGPRPEYHSGYYAAFVLDLDGNNIEAVYHKRA